MEINFKSQKNILLHSHDIQLESNLVLTVNRSFFFLRMRPEKSTFQLNKYIFTRKGTFSALRKADLSTRKFHFSTRKVEKEHFQPEWCLSSVLTFY